jgi:two-component system cell cycle sensor histidine kinase/response regulator CckA
MHNLKNFDAVQRRNTVLLAEDNEGFRRVARMFLEKVGLTVLEATDGNQAAQLAEMHAGQIDLLISDIGIPGLDGRELARHFRTLNPSAFVLLISGLPAEEPDCAFLAKPFPLKRLVEVVRQLLAVKSAEAQRTSPLHPITYPPS